MSLVIHTVGHSTRSLEDLIVLLRAHGIELVADVRAHPRSRRHPWFHDEALAESLPAAGIEYRGFRRLGGRRKARADSPNRGLRDEALRAYADYMETSEFGQALSALLALAARRRTALMCAEADWRRCHRQLLADALLSRGVEVVHLIDPSRVESHRLTEHARIVDGRLSYPPAQDSLF
jgi:uncharacterized protein (DUF488 family)